MAGKPASKLEKAGVWGSNTVEFEGRLNRCGIGAAITSGRGWFDTAVELSRSGVDTAVESGRSDIDWVWSG